MHRGMPWPTQNFSPRALRCGAKTPAIHATLRHRRRYAQLAGPLHFQRPSPVSSLLTTGSVKVKIVPPPGFGRCVIEPPCDSIIVREIDRPTPMPWVLVVMNG